MEKRKLSAIPRPIATPEMMEVADRLGGMRHIVTAELIDDKKILLLNFFEIQALKKEKTEAAFRTFLSHDDYITQDLKTSKTKWLTASFAGMYNFSLMDYVWNHQENKSSYRLNVFMRSDEELKIVKDIFDSFGKSEVVGEYLIDAVIGVSGSSPAYVFMFIEAMADAAVMAGMPRKQAYNFAAQSVLGSAKMVLESGKHPGELKDMVCSPAGTTIDAVVELEKLGFRNICLSENITADRANFRTIYEQMAENEHTAKQIPLNFSKLIESIQRTDQQKRISSKDQ